MILEVKEKSAVPTLLNHLMAGKVDAEYILPLSVCVAVAVF